MKLLHIVSQLSLICVCLTLIAGMVMAQQAGSGRDDNGLPKVVTLPNAARAFLSNNSLGVQTTPVGHFVALPDESSTIAGHHPQSGGPPSPGPHLQITTKKDTSPQPPPPPPACPGVGGLCQLFVVGRAGQGTVLESLRDPNNPDAPGGSVFIDLTLPPAPGVSPIPGRLNVHSTRVDRVAVAQRAVDNLWRDASLPDIKLGINPDPGLVGMWHWFWVRNYQGEPLVFPLHLELPWTLSWQERITVTSMECDDATCQTQHAVATSHLEDHSANYVDTVDVSVTLTPAEFHWDFGMVSEEVRSHSIPSAAWAAPTPIPIRNRP